MHTYCGYSITYLHFRLKPRAEEDFNSNSDEQLFLVLYRLPSISFGWTPRTWGIVNSLSPAFHYNLLKLWKMYTCWQGNVNMIITFRNASHPFVVPQALPFYLIFDVSKATHGGCKIHSLIYVSCGGSPIWTLIFDKLGIKFSLATTSLCDFMQNYFGFS